MTITIDSSAIKAKQQAMWASGDFAVVGTTLQIVGETLCEAVDLRSRERVLDVAAGNGNATLAAARRFARVTSTDYVPALLERGRRRAEAEGVNVGFDVLRRTDSISRSNSPTRKRCPTRPRASTSCCRHLASCSPRSISWPPAR